MKIKALSYNIHKGFCIRGKRYILEDIKKTMSLFAPDLIFLQEVVGHHTHEKFINPAKETEFVDQVKYLAEKTYPYSIYGGNKFHSYGHHGNAILSRFPIKKWANIDLSTNRFERRGFLWANIEIPERKEPLLVANTHLNLLEQGRRIQAVKIVELLDKIYCGNGMLMAGDFNDWRKKMLQYLHPKLQVHDAFLKLHQKHRPSFPSFSPRLSLDRIYYKDLEIMNIVSLEGDPWKRLSDHLPLYVEFQA